MSVVVLIPPESEPITLDEAKLFLKVEHAEDDTLIQDLVITCRKAAEVDCNRSFVPQTLRYMARWDGSGLLHLPRGPVREIVSVETEAQGGAGDPVWYDLQGDTVHRRTLSYPARRFRAVSVTYVAGDDEMPHAARQAVLRMIWTQYHHRSDIATGTAATAMPETARDLLDTIRRVTI